MQLTMTLKTFNKFGTKTIINTQTYIALFSTSNDHLLLNQVIQEIHFQNKTTANTSLSVTSWMNILLDL